MTEIGLAAKFKKISTATLTMQLLKRGIKSIWMHGPKPLGLNQDRIAGPAYTLRFLPGREDLNGPEILKRTDLAQRRAIEPLAEPIVIQDLRETRFSITTDQSSNQQDLQPHDLLDPLALNDPNQSLPL